MKDMSDPHALLKIKGLEKKFDLDKGWLETLKIKKGRLRQERRAVHAVNNVSLDVHRGEAVCVVGESGCGKSTVARLVAGLLTPTKGEIHYGGQRIDNLSRNDMRPLRKKIQMIFQNPYASLNPRMTILQSVIEPLDIIGEGDRQSRRRTAADALERVGLPATIGKRYPHELSGGQKQRVNIARTLTLRPKFIVCDEVVAALDVSIRGAILNLFADLQKEFGITYAFITHDISVVSHVSDRIGVLYLGRLMEQGPADAVSDRPLHPYTQALLSAEPLPLPSDRRDSRRRIRLEGEIPSPLNPPSGCPFRTRCPKAATRCAEQVPQWRELRPSHWVACHFAEPDL